MSLPWLDEQRQALNLALTQQRLGHAPLLLGPEGLGKRSLAQWLVARILCQSPQAGEPCGQCRSCQLLAAGSHPDLFQALIPEDKSQIPVDVIRELCQGLQLTPSIGRCRVGLIEPAEAMNRNAANALLKTLEEPSDQTWLVLVSHDPERLPATIRSRCQKIAIRVPAKADASAWLSRQSPETDPDELQLALMAAGGAPCRALELLQGDGLTFGLDIRRSLLALATDGSIAAETTTEWAKRAQETWFWIGHWLHQCLGQSLGLADRGHPHWPQPAHADSLNLLWQQALQGRQLADSSIRADLLLDKWLLEWSSSFESRD